MYLAGHSCSIWHNHYWGCSKFLKRSLYMVLYKECCLTNLFRNISNYLHHSFRNIDEKAQSILSEFLQTTKNEIDYSGYFANYKHCFKNYISINLLKIRKCTLPARKFRKRHLDLSGLTGNQPIY